MTESPNILTQAGYWARYQEIYSECRTDKDAWRRLEEELNERYGIGRYESYDSFRNCKSRFYKKHRKAQDIIR